MPLTNRQGEGLAAIVALAVIFYVLNLLAPLTWHPKYLFIPLSGGTPGAMAIALNNEGREEGVYFMPPGATLNDLTLAAGKEIPPHNIGSNPDKRDNFVLTKETPRLQAGDKIYLSASNSFSFIGRMSASQLLALDLPLDINRVTVDELILLPGIGEKTAIQIINLRGQKGRFRNLEELKEIKGIKDKKLSDLRKYLLLP